MLKMLSHPSYNINENAVTGFLALKEQKMDPQKYNLDFGFKLTNEFDNLIQTLSTPMYIFWEKNKVKKQ